jgi:hypothetical protein
VIVATAKWAWGLVAGQGRWLLLLAVAAAAATLYAWGAHVRAERDGLIAWADRTCAATAVPFAASAVDPATPVGTVLVYPRGTRCEAEIRALVAFRHDAAISTARLLADAIAEQDAKRTRDVATAARAARDARAAATIMENANAKVGPDDRVGRDWFDALNRTAGLRDAAR